MTSQANQLITIHFTIKDEKDNVVDSTEGQQPYSFLSGTHQMFPKVEEKIGQMEIGSKISMDLSPDDAYGEYDENGLKSTARSGFPDGVELKEGMTFLTQQDGVEAPVTIKKVESENVTIDFNHPMAGQAVVCDVELIDIRAATEEELSGQHAHEGGCGCDH
ncbi:MAG: peptidylprolyl isomerase [Proteobacteria bacterium]|nr:peptidylprolyl isomerase [Pseudomonadota bacterium]